MESKITDTTQATILYKEFLSITLKFLTHLPVANELKHWSQSKWPNILKYIYLKQFFFHQNSDEICSGGSSWQ